jgi:hypothetical protein
MCAVSAWVWLSSRYRNDDRKSQSPRNQRVTIVAHAHFEAIIQLRNRYVLLRAAATEYFAAISAMMLRDTRTHARTVSVSSLQSIISLDIPHADANKTRAHVTHMQNIRNRSFLLHERCARRDPQEQQSREITAKQRRDTCCEQHTNNCVATFRRNRLKSFEHLKHFTASSSAFQTDRRTFGIPCSHASAFHTDIQYQRSTSMQCRLRNRLSVRAKWPIFSLTWPNIHEG